VNRPLLALAIGAATALTAATGASAASSQTLGPVVVGWWSTAHRSAAVPAFAPPDVGPRDLYVAGSNALPAALDALGGPTGPVAVAGLSFQLPAGASARQLQVRLAGVHPPAVTLTACRALQPFTTAYGGPWADAPAYDCRDAGTARLDADGVVVLDGVDRLRRGRDLDVVLVPGPLDRVVVAAPDARTLTVSTPTSAGLSAGALQPPAGRFPAPGSGAPAADVPALGGAPLTAGRPPGVAQPPAPSTASAPRVAAPAPAPASAAASVALPARPWPALLATLLLALLAFVPLVRPQRPEGAAGPVGERGVGRFRSERSGTVPDLG
jgi:hypothetical protein